MNRIVNLNTVISSTLKGLCIPSIDIKIDNNIINGDVAINCIIKYFKLEKFYLDRKPLVVDEHKYKLLEPYLNLYSKKNILYAKLTDELKEYLNELYIIDEIYNEFRKYNKNRFTNKEVVIYILDLIDKKELYKYEKYKSMKKDEAKKEIAKINKIFKILNALDFEIDEIGIRYKSVTFKHDSYEYNNISPCLCFSIYDINYYKRILDLLKKRTS